MNELKQFGFVAPKEIKLEEWRFGSGNIKGEVLQPDGNWSAYLPKEEFQAIDYETAGCTVYGGLNQREILHKRLFGVEPNYAERFNYILGGVTLAGNDPHKTYESIRKDGVIIEELLPRPKTYAEYNSPRPMSSNFIKEGKKSLEQYEYKHDWLFTQFDGLTKEQRRQKINTALKFCPVAASFTAWIKEGDVYVDGGMLNTHWGVIFGDSDKGYLTFDTYDQTIKIVSHDHNIQFAKTIFLAKKDEKTVITNTVWSTLLKFGLLSYFVEWFKRFFTPKPPQEAPPQEEKPKETPKDILLREAIHSVGLDVTPNDEVNDEVACAVSLSTVIRKSIDDTFPLIAYTPTLKKHLDSSPLFKQTMIYKPGCILVSPTIEGVFKGHCGVMGEKEVIYSNNSRTGNWDSHFTLASWIGRYRNGGLHLYFYEPVNV